VEIKIKWIPRKQMTHENKYRDDTYLVHVQKCSYVSNQSNEVQRRKFTFKDESTKNSEPTY
jgi:hypothetical protein